MSAPFQAYLNPFVGQFGVPNSTAYGSGDQNPNPNPVMNSTSNPLGWANMNTTAPWMTPNGLTGQNPFSGAGSWNYIGNSEQSSPSGLFGLGGSLFGLGKKYNLPDISSPSYQGTLFNPDSGPYAQNYGASYGMSPEGQAASYQSPTQPQPIQASNTPNPLNNSSLGNFSGGNQYAGSSGLQGYQSFVGQSPYGVAGGTYVPGQGQSSSSYGGYGNYGGYASSGSGMGSTYVPGQ